MLWIYNKALHVCSFGNSLVSLVRLVPFVSGNIETLWKTKLAVSLGSSAYLCIRKPKNYFKLSQTSVKRASTLVLNDWAEKR